MSNFDLLISILMSMPKDYPVLVSISPVVIGAVLYFLGKIRASHLWQIQMDKYLPFLHGVIFITTYVFNPILILLVISNFWKLLTLNGLLLITFYIFFSVVIPYCTNKIINISTSKPRTKAESKFVKNLVEKIQGNLKIYLLFAITKTIFPILLYFFSYLVLTTTNNIWILFAVIFLDFLSLIFFANIDLVVENEKRVNIELIDENFENARIIEFLNNGNLIKLQTKKGKVIVIPTKEMKSIELLS